MESQLSDAKRIHERALSNARNAKWRASPQGLAWEVKNEARPERKAQHAKSAASFRRRYPERVRKTCRDCQIKNPAARMLRGARTRALKRKQPFSLTVADLGHLPEFCPVLGLRLKYYGESVAGADDTASIDCLDPKVGYVVGNIAVVSMRANTIKNSGTAAEHRAIAEWMEKCHGTR